MNELSKIKHIKRIVVGSHGDSDDTAKKIEEINKLLNGFPKCHIIGRDITYKFHKIGEHTLVSQVVCYHLGFERVP